LECPASACEAERTDRARDDCCREVGRPEVAGETHGGESGEAPQGEHGADRRDAAETLAQLPEQED